MRASMQHVGHLFNTSKKRGCMLGNIGVDRLVGLQYTVAIYVGRIVLIQ